MTEYGRNPGSQPWHPEDPLYGDQGWGGQQAGGAHYQQQPQYGGHQDAYQQGYAGQGHDEAGRPYDTGTPGGDPYGTGAQDRQYGSGHAQPYDTGAHARQQYDTGTHGGQQYGPGTHGAQQYDGGTHGGQQYDGGTHGAQQYDGGTHGGQQYGGGWDTGTGQPAAMAYGPPPPADPYGGQGADPYSTPEAYPPPQPPGQRRAEPHPHDAHPRRDADDGTGEWREDAPREERRGFFDGPDDDAGRDGGDDAGRDGRDDGADGSDDHDGGYDDEPAESRRAARESRGRTKKRKSRNGVACLFVALVLAGGLGGVGYFGYQFWQDRFGPSPDFTGTGTGEAVTVEVPKDAVGAEIGGILLKAGVVKSVDAFVTAQEKNPKGLSIQPGFYTLQKGMSAASAVEAMLSPKSRNVLIIPEGRRNAWVYEQIDKRLELAPGTTKKTALEKAGTLGLPAWATGHPNVKDPLEGFLFPADYPVAKGNKPEDVLKRMVTRANSEYGKVDLAAKAKGLGLKSPWELITVASLVQAEGKTEDDFRKMSEVVYNRLKPDNTETNQKLQFDSAFNYLRGQSEIKISESEINSNPDPYNTYYHRGLTPGPIGNPGAEALAAALEPTSDGWMYFVATDGMHKTEFAKTHDDFLKLKDKFNDNQGG
ncbi:endolytic transglycosylase MltG [Streptomyces sp. DH12]|uniref:endolytic transglycosylase MltG n=1 Tax=Streptomyces sp. DH12 TaxID=2857010 RepID=UPI001E4B6390|nr:endolytic transglycosylase MltG [Streptomyces sp. DH12]